MSLEAIKTISEAEDKARHVKADASAAGKDLIAKAEAKGMENVKKSKESAQVEVAEKRQLVAEVAKKQALNLIRGTENKKAAMLVKAEGRTDEAVNLVIERIVNS